MRRHSILCILGAAVCALASRGSDFPVSAERAASFGCSGKCYELLQLTIASDLSIVAPDFDWDFYAVPCAFSANTSRPGDILRLQPLNPRDLTAVVSGVSAWRFQYVSADLDGTPVPVSAFIALPGTPPVSGAFPLVAFAHGTIGAYPGCAVSNGPGLWDYSTWSQLSLRGYAVVATDYAGLGVNATSHKYGSFAAHAADVFHAVTAARRTPFGPLLSAAWLAVGHSQGGGAVWKLAELVADLAAANGSLPSTYLGTVALAPATRVVDMARLAAAHVLPRADFHAWAVAALVPYLTLGLRRFAGPGYGTSLLGEAMSKRMELAAEAQLCVSATMGLTMDLAAADLTTLGGSGMSTDDMAAGERWQNVSAPGRAAAAGPVLVVQSIDDTAILYKTTEAVWETACAAGSQVQLLVYQKQDHSGILTAAAADWLAWVDARFRGEAAPTRCSKTVRKVFAYDHVVAQPEIDLDSGSL